MHIFHKPKKKGFTLVEIMGVVTLIAILFAIFVPKIGFAANKAKVTGVQSDFRSYQTALQAVALEHGGFKSITADTADKNNTLAAAVNIYLDQELQLTGVASALAIKKEDPWGNPYQTEYDEASDTVFIYSKGVNGNSETTMPNWNDIGDDYVLVATGKNIETHGFSQNVKTGGGTSATNTYGPVPENVTDYYTFTMDSTTGGYKVGLNAAFKTALSGAGTAYKDWTPGNPLPNPGSTYNGQPVTSMRKMFYKRSATSLDLSSFDTSNVTNMNGMFDECSFTSLDLSSFDTSNVTNMKSMFEDCSVTSLDLSSFDTSKVTNMNSMFRGCKVTSLDLSSFDTSKVTDMSYMFSCCSVTSLDLSSFDTSKVTDMDSMFDDCSATSLDLSSFDTSKVTNMENMFDDCSATSLDLSSFDTSNVTDMNWMFNRCSAPILDLSSFDTSKVTNMGQMFYYCSATSLDLSSFDTSKVTDMYQMFSGCSATSLDLSSFDTSKVTEMYSMFSGCKATSLDLSSFDTSNVTDMRDMFRSCSAATGYARTQTDASKFNASDSKPSTLTFVVK